VELYRGELLAGAVDEWVLNERGWLAEQFHDAVAALATLLEDSGDLSHAVEVAHRGVAADPLREESHRLLIRLLLTAGRAAAARGQYDELVRLLAQHLDAEPDDATRRLFDAIPGAPNESSPPHAVAPSHPLPLTPSPLPSGTVTFLLTDIEGSTARWEERGEGFRSSLYRHHALLRQAVAEHGGREVKELGDGFLIAFSAAVDALAAAIAAQRALAGAELCVRMALHTGDVEPERGDYHSLVIHHAARVLRSAHGGQILCSEATAVLLRGGLVPEIRLVDLGAFRLRDIGVPQRLFHVEYPGMLRRDFPLPRAESAFTGHLPQQLTRFFGREAEIAALVQMLQSPESRLVTMVGPGGTGKTRLALAVAEALRRAPASRVWFVPLADLSAADLIPDAIREVLGLPGVLHRDPFDQIAEVLSQQPGLLILDNFEHLVEDGASMLLSLLNRIPSLTCLITSRRILDLEGEREFPVPPLPVPDPLEGPGDPDFLLAVARCPSVQLFVDRAQAVRPDFQVTAGNVAAVATLCRKLEGIPLGVELAAGRARVLSPAQMAAQFERQAASGAEAPPEESPLRLLATRRRGVPARHQSLWSAVEWSYCLLPVELQRFFARVSVFRGGWTSAAAASVCDEPAALEALEELRGCSLVVAEEWPLPVGMRFRTLEPLREFGWEQLSRVEQRDLQRQHVRYYLRLAQQAEPALLGEEQVATVDRLAVEVNNLRAALDWCQTGGDAELGLRLAVALYRFWSTQGQYAEGQERLRALLTRACGTDPTVQPAAGVAAVGAELWGRALTCAGSLAVMVGELGVAGTLCREGLALSRQLGDSQTAALAFNVLGSVERFRGELEAGRIFYEESLKISRGDPANRWDTALTLFCLGATAFERGALKEAATLLEESQQLFRQAGDRHFLALCLDLHARALSRSGLVDNTETLCRVRELQREAIRLLRSLHNLWGIAVCLDGLASSAAAQDDWTRAARLLGAADAQRRAIGAPLYPTIRSDHEHTFAATKAALGDTAFATAFEEGAGMAVDEIIRDALGEDVP
jgi:predicted ATPase/class 3 adenylate cyclase